MNLRKLKIQFFRKPLIISLLIALFIAGIVKAVPPVSPYRPGETLDPSCFPGDPNCTVSPPLPTYISTTTIVELNNNLLSFNTGTVSILGNLGIGTTTPTYRLTLNGDFFVSATSTLGSLTSTPVIFGGYVMSDIIPYSDLTYNLGSSFFRWANLYAGTTTISNSLNLSYLTPGSVLFAGPSGQISQNNQKLFWDNTNFRLGIGTNTPQGILHVTTGTVNALVVDDSGNVGIGTTVPAYTLDVNTTKDWGGVRIVGTQNVQLVFESPTGFTPQYTFVQGGITRFTNFVSSDGSYWAIGRFDDDGNYLNAPLTILRNTGNVGIGTTAPSQKLTVVGNIGIQAGANAFVGTLDNYALSLRTNNTDRIFITNTGNVGIGTTAPAGKLHVVGYSQFWADPDTYSSVAGFYSNNPEAPYINWYHRGTRYLYIQAGTSTNPFAIIGLDNGANLGIIGGNVGIGTTAPAGKLHVVGYSQFWADPDTYSSVAGFYSNNPEAPYINWYHRGTRYLYIQAGTSTNPFAIIGLDNGANLGIIGGNVGIGTTAPAELLDVNGVSRFLGIVKISSVLQGDSGANFDLNLRPGSSLGNIIFKSNDDTELMRITNNGNVGIGTTTPAYKLSVQGSIQQTNALSCALSSDANGQIICTVSSLKYKENIQDLAFDSERFLSLQPRSFEFKKDLPFYLPGKQVGFIAEEVQNVFPDLVRYKDGEPEGVKYENLPIYLFAIIKDFFNKMKNGLITFKDIVVDKLSANYIIVKELEAEKVVSKELCSSTGKCVQVTDELINKLIELSSSNSGLSSPSNGGNNNPGTTENNNQQNSNNPQNNQNADGSSNNTTSTSNEVNNQNQESQNSNGGNNNLETTENNNQQNSNNEVNNRNQENQTSNNSNQTSNENQTNSGSGETTSNNQTPSDQSNSSNP